MSSVPRTSGAGPGEYLGGGGGRYQTPGQLGVRPGHGQTTQSQASLRALLVSRTVGREGLGGFLGTPKGQQAPSPADTTPEEHPNPRLVQFPRRTQLWPELSHPPAPAPGREAPLPHLPPPTMTISLDSEALGEAGSPSSFGKDLLLHSGSGTLWWGTGPEGSGLRECEGNDGLAPNFGLFNLDNPLLLLSVSLSPSLALSGLLCVPSLLPGRGACRS